MFARAALITGARLRPSCHKSILTRKKQFCRFTPSLSSMPTDPSESVTFFDVHNAEKKVPFNDLKSMIAEQKQQKGRDLIRIIQPGHNISYRFMSPNELEVAVRKARHHKLQISYETVNEDGSKKRIRERQVMIRHRMQENDLKVAVKKIQKWLKDESFVQVKLKVPADWSEAEQNTLIGTIQARALDGLDDKAQNISFKIIN